MIDLDFFQRVRDATKQWFPDEMFSIEPVLHARTNETFVVYVDDRRYILQALNTTAHPDAKALMSAQAQIFLALEGAADWNYALPNPLVSPEGGTLLSYADRQWRLTDYFEQTEILEAPQAIEQAHSAGRAFGSLRRLHAPPGLPLAHPERFSVDRQWAKLEKSLASSTKDPATSALVVALKPRLQKYRHQQTSADIDKLRLIHGDCRIENLLYSSARTDQRSSSDWASQSSGPQFATNEVVAMLDFDNAGMGRWWCDFGSLVAQVALRKEAGFDPNIYLELARGYFAGESPLIPKTVDQAIHAAPYMCLLRCIRFIEDHVAGDLLFRVPGAGYNLEAAKAELMALDILENPAHQHTQRDILQNLNH